VQPEWRFCGPGIIAAGDRKALVLESAFVPLAAENAADDCRCDHQGHKARAKQKISHVRTPARHSSTARSAQSMANNLQEG
jgi:hypothetical protein